MARVAVGVPPVPAFGKATALYKRVCTSMYSLRKLQRAIVIKGIHRVKKNLQKPHREKYRLVLVAAILMPPMVRLLPLVIGPHRLWGIDYLQYFSPFWIVVYTLGVALFALPAADGLMDGLVRFLEKPSGKWIGPTGLLLLGLIIILYPMKTFYLGDGNNIVPEVYKLGSDPSYHSSLLLNLRSAPLSGVVIYGIAVWIPKLSMALGFGAPETSLFPFQILGLIFLVCFGAVLLLVRNHVDRTIAMTGFLGLGGTLMFFGYVEFYLVAYIAVVFYLLAAERYLESSLPLWVVLLAYVLALASHYMILSLLPSMVYLLLYRHGREVALARSLKSVALASFAVLIAGCAVYFAAGFHSSLSRIVMPMVPQVIPAGVQSYVLLSMPHLLDLINLPLLLCMAPLLFVALVSMTGKWSRYDTALTRFGFLVVFFFAVFLFFANTGFGLARDWDITAIMGVLVGFFSYRIVLPRLAGKNQSMALRLAMASCVFIVPWIVVNVEPEHSTHRFRNVMSLDDRNMFGDYALSGYEALRKQFLHENEYDQEMEMEQKMIDLVGYPEQYRLMIKTSLLFATQRPGKFLEAQRWMLERLGTAASNLNAHNERVEYAIGMKAIDSLATAVTANATTYQVVPRLEREIRNVVQSSQRPTPEQVRDGFLAVENTDYAEGIRKLTAVLQSDFHAPRVYALLGGALLSQKRLLEADSIFAEGLKRFPKEGEIHYLIGLIFLTEHYRTKDARLHLETALDLDPSPDMDKQIRQILSQLPPDRH